MSNTSLSNSILLGLAPEKVKEVARLFRSQESWPAMKEALGHCRLQYLEVLADPSRNDTEVKQAQGVAEFIKTFTTTFAENVVALDEQDGKAQEDTEVDDDPSAYITTSHHLDEALGLGPS